MNRSLSFVLLVMVLAGCDLKGIDSSPSASREEPQASPTSDARPRPTATMSRPGTKTNGEGVAPTVSIIIAPVPANIPAYDRDDWRHWIDVDSDCQNTRHEVLIEESTTAVTFTNTQQCTVATGLWNAPFAGVVVETARSLDVDHMVPLANAHKSGGWAWSAERKRDYANDMDYLGHLIAVTASANRSKGARGPEDWRPEDETYWCGYAVDWVTIKSTWELSVTPTEWEALDDMLGACSTRPTVIVLAGAGISVPTVSTATETFDTTDLPFDPRGPDKDCGDLTDWREAQAFYLASGGPESDPHRLDGDNDGVACESLAGAP